MAEHRAKEATREHHGFHHANEVSMAVYKELRADRDTWKARAEAAEDLVTRMQAVNLQPIDDCVCHHCTLRMARAEELERVLEPFKALADRVIPKDKQGREWEVAGEIPMLATDWAISCADLDAARAALSKQEPAQFCELCAGPCQHPEGAMQHLGEQEPRKPCWARHDCICGQSGACLDYCSSCSKGESA